jgi:O-antigen/teichoic acid export membrane protein
MKWLKHELGFDLFRIELVSSVFGALISIGLAKTWGTQVQGEWSVLNNFASTGALIFTAGLPSVLISLIRRKMIFEKSLMNRLGFYFMVILIGMTILIYVLSLNSNMKFLFSELVYTGGGYFLLSVQVTLLTGINILGAWMDAKNKLKQLSGARLIFNMVLFLVIALLCYTYAEDLHKLIQYIWYTFLLHALITAIYMIYTLLPVPPGSGKDIRDSHTILSMISKGGWIYLCADLFQKLNYRLDIWFLSALKTNVEVGVYSIASSISLFLLIRSRNSQRVLINKFKAGDGYGNDLLVKSEISLLSRQMIGLTVLFLMAAFLLFKFLGNAYAPGFPVLIFLSLGIYAVSVTMPYSAYFIFMHSPVYNFAAAAVGLVINVLFNYILIPKFDIWGATLASVFTYLAVAGTLYLYYRRALRPIPAR